MIGQKFAVDGGKSVYVRLICIGVLSVKRKVNSRPAVVADMPAVIVCKIKIGNGGIGNAFVREHGGGSDPDKRRFFAVQSHRCHIPVELYREIRRRGRLAAVMIIDGFGSEIEALVAVFGNIGTAEFVIGGRKIYHIVNDAVVKSEIHAVDIERIAIGSAVFLREEAGITSGTVEEDLFAAEIQFPIRIKQKRIVESAEGRYSVPTISLNVL